MSDGSSIGEDLDYEYEYEDEYTYDEDIEEDLPNPPQLTRQVSYTCVASDTVMDEIRKLVDEVKDVLCVSADDSSILLRHNRWNKETVEARWFDEEAKLRENLGLSAVAEEPAFMEVDENTVECAVCDDEVPKSSMHWLPCGHAFCRTCWGGYISDSVNTSGQGVLSLRCMDTCNEHVRDTLIRQCSDPDTLTKFDKRLLESYVDRSAAAKWCPTGCGRITLRHAALTPDVRCDCGHIFCYRCCRMGHQPATCEQVEKWEEKNSAESENVTWIVANTKRCPKAGCGTPIEKNQGCNHMTCKSCAHEFCWLCLGAWSDHGASTGGYYECNRYQKKQGDASFQAAEKAREGARESLNFYMHYYERFKNHERAKKMGLNLLEAMDEYSHQLTSSGIDFQKTTFLRDAVTQVTEARRILQWTYVFAHYLPQEAEKRLFEYLQEKLEKNVEHLHGLVEGARLRSLLDTDWRTVAQEPFMIFRGEVTNYTASVKKFLDSLLVGVQNGLTDDEAMAELRAREASTSGGGGGGGAPSGTSSRTAAPSGGGVKRKASKRP